MFKIVGTNIIDGSDLIITTDYPFEFLDECGWEFATLEGIYVV